MSTDWFKSRQKIPAKKLERIWTYIICTTYPRNAGLQLFHLLTLHGFIDFLLFSRFSFSLAFYIFTPRNTTLTGHWEFLSKLFIFIIVFVYFGFSDFYITFRSIIALNLRLVSFIIIIKACPIWIKSTATPHTSPFLSPNGSSGQDDVAVQNYYCAVRYSADLCKIQIQQKVPRARG